MSYCHSVFNFYGIKMKRTLSVNIVNVCAVTLLTFVLSLTVVRSFYSMGVIETRLDTSDFKYSDAYNTIMYNEARCKFSDKVVLVNIHNCDNAQIFETVDSIEKYSPSAVGIDILFRQHDSITSTSHLAQYDNVVLAGDAKHCPLDTYFSCIPRKKIGIVRSDATTLTEVARTFTVSYPSEDGVHLGFPVEVVRVAYPEKFRIFESDKRVKRDNKAVINYQTALFDTIHAETVLAGASEWWKELVHDRIVLIGDLEDDQDIFLTPLSKGKRSDTSRVRRGPMCGLMINAYSVETILNGPLIREVPKVINWLIAILTCCALLCLNRLYSNWFPNGASLLIRLTQIAALFVFLAIGCACFHYGNRYLDFVPAMLMISLSSLANDMWNGAVAVAKKRKKT